jgi:hypothetical protein
LYKTDEFTVERVYRREEEKKGRDEGVFTWSMFYTEPREDGGEVTVAPLNTAYCILSERTPPPRRFSDTFLVFFSPDF